jgi:hypothetical protein
MEWVRGAGATAARLAILGLFTGCGPLPGFDLGDGTADGGPGAGQDAGVGAKNVIEFQTSGAGVTRGGSYADYAMCSVDAAGTFTLHNTAASAPEVALDVHRFDLHQTAAFTDIAGYYVDQPGHFYSSGSSTHCQLTLGFGPTRAHLTGDFSCGGLRDGAGNEAQLGSGHFDCCIDCP